MKVIKQTFFEKDGEYDGVICGYQPDPKSLFMECSEIPFGISLLKIQNGKSVKCHRMSQQFGSNVNPEYPRRYNNKVVTRKQHISYLNKYCMILIKNWKGNSFEK
mgnify:CR=1